MSLSLSHFGFDLVMVFITSVFWWKTYCEKASTFILGCFPSTYTVLPIHILIFIFFWVSGWWGILITEMGSYSTLHSATNFLT